MAQRPDQAQEPPQRPVAARPGPVPALQALHAALIEQPLAAAATVAPRAAGRPVLPLLPRTRVTRSAPRGQARRRSTGGAVS